MSHGVDWSLLFACVTMIALFAVLGWVVTHEDKKPDDACCRCGRPTGHWRYSTCDDCLPTYSIKAIGASEFLKIRRLDDDAPARNRMEHDA
jgi:hypothetical protein